MSKNIFDRFVLGSDQKHSPAESVSPRGEDVFDLLALVEASCQILPILHTFTRVCQLSLQGFEHFRKCPNAMT